MACEALLAYSLLWVTYEDVAAFAPSDPGYADYVREFCKIVETGMLPKRVGFSVTETIGLTRWVRGKDLENERFRRFRVFTNSVALLCCVRGKLSGDELPENYSIIGLIDDAEALGDAALWPLLQRAFSEVYEVLRGQDSEELVFARLGGLLVSARMGMEAEVLSEMAEALIEEEKRYAGRASGDFVLGCTFFGQLHESWKRYVKRFFTATVPGVGWVREGILGDGAAS